MNWNAFMQKRLSRGHYWIFFVGYIYLGFILGGIAVWVFPAALTVIDILFRIVGIAFGLAFTMARFRDQDMKPWFAFIPFYNFISPLVDEGTKGPNRFGPEPEQLSDRQAKILKGFAIPALILFTLELLLDFLA